MKLSDQALNDFWDWYRRSMGFNPDEGMTVKESEFWHGINRQRELCLQSENPSFAIYESPPFDKQYFLHKWWNKLNKEDQRRYLIHVWLNKGPGFLYGYDWWFPYFKEVGFSTNCKMDKPTEEVMLYRGSLPVIRYGLSWTKDKEFAQLFASQHEESKVYKAIVKPENILGIISGIAGSHKGDRYEGIEYVVNYNEIEYLQEI